MVLSILLLVLASSCVAIADLISKCPPMESIAPCSCNAPYPNMGSSIRCDIRSYKTFQGVLHSLKGYKVHYLDVGGVNTSMLSTDMFQGLHIKNLRLYVAGVDEKSLGHSHFAGLENSLVDLDMQFDSDCTASLSSVRLGHLRSLKNIQFVSLGTHEIGNDWFEAPENFEFFIASLGGLKKVGDKAFASLPNLRILTLSYNELKEISRSMLPNPANRLHVLNLSDNKIRTLPSDIFTGMPALTGVILRNNLIQTLPEDTWSPVFYRMRTEYLMAFVGNPLRCDQDLRWACEVNVSEFGETKCASPYEKKGIYVKDFCKA